MALVGDVIVPIAVAVLPALIAAWAVIRRHRRDISDLRSENTEQHNVNSGLLQHVASQVTGIDKKIDRLDGRVDSLQLWASEHEKDHLLADQ